LKLILLQKQNNQPKEEDCYKNIENFQMILIILLKNIILSKRIINNFEFPIKLMTNKNNQDITYNFVLYNLEDDN